MNNKNQTKLTSKCNFCYNSLGLAKKNHRNNIEILMLYKMWFLYQKIVNQQGYSVHLKCNDGM